MLNCTVFHTGEVSMVMNQMVISFQQIAPLALYRIHCVNHPSLLDDNKINDNKGIKVMYVMSK